VRALVVTNMYPTTRDPARGTFVRDQVEALRRLDGVDVDVRASFGLALFPRDSATVDGLLRCADLAMYAAKEAGQGPVFYDPSHECEAHERQARLSLGSEADPVQGERL
jgi:predicted signal transduction protein with EAL and GGDEF domain